MKSQKKTDYSHRSKYKTTIQGYITTTEENNHRKVHSESNLDRLVDGKLCDLQLLSHNSLTAHLTFPFANYVSFSEIQFLLWITNHSENFSGGGGWRLVDFCQQKLATHFPRIGKIWMPPSGYCQNLGTPYTIFKPPL